MKRIFTILYYTYFILLGLNFIIIAAIIWLLTFWWDKRMYASHYFTNIWSKFLLYINPGWKFEIKGKEKINNNRNYVIISNHQSEYDIPAISLLGMHFKWVSKAEVFKVPIVGWNMWFNQYIKLVRGNKRSIIQMIKNCGKAITNGSSVFIFPEGTRSETGKIQNFMPGAFVIAKRNKVGILPIVIDGTINIMNKNSLLLNQKARIKIEVLDEISYNEIKDMSEEEIAQKTKQLIELRLALSNNNLNKS